MIEHSVYIKTHKGLDEIARLSWGLPLRQRRLLVLVDGRTRGEALIAKACILGESVDALNELEAAGYIAPLQANAQQRTPDSEARSTDDFDHSPGGRQRRSLVLSRLYLNEYMTRLLGSEADAVREGLRAATSRAALLVQLDICVALVTQRHDADRAMDLKAAVIALLPADPA